MPSRLELRVANRNSIGGVRLVVWTLCWLSWSPAFASPGARAAWSDAGDQAASALCRDGGSLRVEAEVNPYDPAEVDRTVTRECAEGMSVLLLSSMATRPEGLPLYAQVKAPAYRLPDSVRVGQSVERVRQSLGAPDEVVGARWIYVLTESGDQLEVEVDREVVVSVGWSFYAG